MVLFLEIKEGQSWNHFNLTPFPLARLAEQSIKDYSIKKKWSENLNALQANKSRFEQKMADKI